VISYVFQNPRVVLSYTTMPSFQMTPNRSFLPTSTERQGIGRHLGSDFQGSAPTTFFAKNSMSSRLRAMGPLTELTASCPANPLFARAVGKRPKEGLKVKIPVQAAGIRREPPIDQSQPTKSYTATPVLFACRESALQKRRALSRPSIIPQRHSGTTSLYNTALFSLKISCIIMAPMRQVSGLSRVSCHRLTDVRANTKYAATKADEGTFATTRTYSTLMRLAALLSKKTILTTRCKVSVERVHSSPESVVDGFRYHHRFKYEISKFSPMIQIKQQDSSPVGTFVLT